MKRIILVWASILFVGLGIPSTTPTLANTAPVDNASILALATTITLHPAADAYVSSAYPTTNYGTGMTLRIDGSPVTTSFLRFTVSGTSAISQATLKLYANSSLSAGVNVYRVSDNTWSETGITFSNAPATLGTLINTSANVISGTWISVDVTSYISGNGTYSLAVTDPSATALSLASRESTNPPQLVITAGTSATATPTKAATSSPTRTPAAGTPTATPASGDVVLVGAGDTKYCNSGVTATGNLIKTISGKVMMIGDSTNTGAPSEYTCFDQEWPFKSRTIPVVGNHEYQTSGATGYYNYYGAAAHGPNGYYSVDYGAWHIIVLNSNCSKAGGCQAGSTQEQWLKADLAAHPTQCKLAMWHHPRFNSGTHGNDTAVAPFWQDLYNAGVHLVLNGHEHNYERFARQNPNGAADPKGIREFIVGTGGAGGGSWSTTQPNSQVHAVSAIGVMKLTLHSSSYSWQFIPVGSTTFTDSGSESCF